MYADVRGTFDARATVSRRRPRATTCAVEDHFAVGNTEEDGARDDGMTRLRLEVVSHEGLTSRIRSMSHCFTASSTSSSSRTSASAVPSATVSSAAVPARFRFAIRVRIW